jgi:hypothetical protein
MGLLDQIPGQVAGAGNSPDAGESNEAETAETEA